MVPVRKEFAASTIVDLPLTVDAALAAGGLAHMVRPGQCAALGLGSRGRGRNVGVRGRMPGRRGEECESCWGR